MKRIILILLFILPFRLSAQKMIFCEKVRNDGTEVNPASIFYIDPKGGFFNVLVKLDQGLTSDVVVFDLYLINDKTGKETFNSSIRLAVQPGNNWFYKEITFFKKGNYHVYVYDGFDRLLSVGKVDVVFKE